MKILAAIFVCIYLSVFNVSCATAPERAQEQRSQGVYAVNDAIIVGRFDLAKVYSDDLVKVTPLPKKRIPIKAMYKRQ